VRILVVDDEPAVLDAVDRALRLQGYDTELATDGREALDALAARCAGRVGARLVDASGGWVGGVPAAACRR